MTESTKVEAGSAKLEEERLAHALLSRGLITREEAQQCRVSGEAAGGAEAFLGRLVEAGLLTSAQAQRAIKELPDLLAQQIPGYELRERLGQGAMGIVYKAQQISLNRLVAVKVLHPRLAGNPRFLETLLNEAHLAAKLSHNNIVQVIDVGSAGNLHYVIMEYVEGTTLKGNLDDGQVYDEREAVEIVLQIAQGLEHAHRRGLVHRDVKPSNIVLTRDGVAKLADLGTAREMDDQEKAQAEKGLMIGTPHYISPEQVRGREDIDGRADIYSLGATLYHMVTGKPPFPAKGVEAAMRAHLDGKYVRPSRFHHDLSKGLDEVVGKMLARERGKRYQRTEDLIVDLECILNDEPPRIARKKMAVDALQELAEGEVEETAEKQLAQRVEKWFWIALTLGAALVVSLLFNLILLRK